MTTSARVIALVVLSVAQLGAAAWSIARYESTLRSGVLYRIRIEPVDPADAFHGRYVAVRPSITVLADDSSELGRLLQLIQGGARGYVVLTLDADGFARVSDVVFTPPAQGDYLEVACVFDQWSRDTKPGETARRVGYTVCFSFDRYYMNEAAAPMAERRYAEASRRNATAKAWLTVRVKNGAGVIEGLFIDGDPIK